MTSQARVYLRHVREADRREFIDLMRQSASLHQPWISPPINSPTFSQYLARTATADHEGFVLARYSDDAITGVINLNNIVRGSFLSASLGYYAGAPYAGDGYMTEGLQLLKRYAFGSMNLHRLEANIQPDNSLSVALVQRCGFTREGLSPAFLFIDGEWRDHERWTCVDSRTSMLPQTTANPPRLRTAMRAVPPPENPQEKPQENPQATPAETHSRGQSRTRPSEDNP